MSHYLKLVIDCIFGEKQYRNEIIWHYASWRGPKKGFNIKHDVLLFYSKNQNFYFDLIKKKSYRTIPQASKLPAGKEGYNKIGKGEMYFYWDANRNKHYTLVQMHSVWNDIGYIQSQSKERTGYPTQKPVALLERIIQASCPEDGVVLDPFCGCATACVAAEKLGRQWNGIDISQKAYELVNIRLEKECSQGTIWENKRETYFQTYPPKRTDIGEIDLPKKWVYVISNSKYPDEFKVGIAKNWKSRLNSYQTAEPNRAYKMEFKVETTKFNEIEKAVHDYFDNRHEWVRANLEDIISKIKELDKV